jgi:hypothetical protein
MLGVKFNKKNCEVPYTCLKKRLFYFLVNKPPPFYFLVSKPHFRKIIYHLPGNINVPVNTTNEIVGDVRCHAIHVQRKNL